MFIWTCQHQDTSKIPENPAMTRIANALVAAHEASGVPNSSIAMVVQHNEKNAYDQHVCCERSHNDSTPKILNTCEPLLAVGIAPR